MNTLLLRSGYHLTADSQEENMAADSDSGTWVVSDNKSFRKVRTTTASAKAMDETAAMFSHVLSRLAKK